MCDWPSVSNKLYFPTGQGYGSTTLKTYNRTAELKTQGMLPHPCCSEVGINSGWANKSSELRAWPKYIWANILLYKWACLSACWSILCIWVILMQYLNQHQHPNKFCCLELECSIFPLDSIPISQRSPLKILEWFHQSLGGLSSTKG